MGIKRQNGNYVINLPERGIKMLVPASQGAVEEAVGLLRHASAFYTTDEQGKTRTRRKRSVSAAEPSTATAAATESGEAPVKKRRGTPAGGKAKSKIVFHIPSEDGGKLTPSAFLRGLLEEAPKGKLPVEEAAKAMAVYATSGSEPAKVKAAERSISTLVRLKKGFTVVKGNLRLLSPVTLVAAG